MRSVLEHLAAVQWTALAVAVAFQVAKLVVRSRAWHNLLQAAFPAAGLRWGAVAGAVLVSAGVNSAAPARLGDLVRVAVVRRGLGARCCLPTIGATMVAEALLDLAVAVLLVGAVVASGRLVGHGEVARAVLGAAGEAAARPWLAAQILSSLVPVADGAGTQQALVVVALHGHAGVSEAVAFSLGLQATVMATNVMLAGGVATVAVQRLGPRGVGALIPRLRRYQSVGL